MGAASPHARARQVRPCPPGATNKPTLGESLTASTTWTTFVGGLLAIAVAAFFWASARTANATCTADPPSGEIPEHLSRSLELGLDGWDCVLADEGVVATTVDLGWWPDDPIAVWTQTS